MTLNLSSLLKAFSALCLLLVAPTAFGQTSWARVQSVFPMGGQRGTTVTVTFTGVHIGASASLLFDTDKLALESIAPIAGRQDAAQAKIRIAPDATLGRHALRVVTALGTSDIAWFEVGAIAEVEEKEPNNTRDVAQEVSLPTVVNGRTNGGEDLDYFRFKAQKGQTVVFDVSAQRGDSPLDAVLFLYDAQGRELAIRDDDIGTDARLLYTFSADGTYIVQVRDLRYQGGDNFRYRLTMGAIPYIAQVFPFGGRAGSSLALQLLGANLGAAATQTIQIPNTVRRNPLSLPLALPNSATQRFLMTADEGVTDVMEFEPNDTPERAQAVSLGTAINGRLSLRPNTKTADVDCFKFRGKKGQTVAIEILDRAFGSRITRRGFVRQPNGQQSDLTEETSRLDITLNGDGDCLVQIADLYQKQGEDYTYRIKITLVKPDFRLSFTPDRIIVGQGARVPVTLSVQRFGGFDGEVRIQYAGTLPEGLQIDGVNAIPKGANATILVFTLPADAKFSHRLFQIEGVAQIEGKEVLREAEAREEFVRDGTVQTRPTDIPIVSVAPPPDMTVSTGAMEFTLSPGGSIEIPIKIARKMGFGAKVPLTVLGLPPGLTITAAPVLEGNQSEGKVAIRAEGNAPIGTFKILAVATSQIDDQRRSPYVSAFLTLNVKK